MASFALHRQPVAVIPELSGCFLKLASVRSCRFSSVLVVNRFSAQPHLLVSTAISLEIIILVKWGLSDLVTSQKFASGHILLYLDRLSNFVRIRRSFDARTVKPVRRPSR